MARACRGRFVAVALWLAAVGLSGWQTTPAAAGDNPIVMRWGTYLGGPSSESAKAVVTTPAGAVAVGGYTFGGGFPSTRGAVEDESSGGADAVTTTLAGDGAEMLYGSYLGGEFQDAVHDVATDDSGAVYLVGEAHSTDFPATTGVVQPSTGGGQDAFVARFAADGSGLEWATYLGGEGSDIAYAVAVDETGSIYVTGRTSSDDFPVTSDAMRSGISGRSDIFVAVVSSDGARLEYATLFGGSNTENRPSSGEAGRAITVDNAGAVYLAGVTDSSDFPVTTEGPVTGRPLGVVSGGGMGDAFVAMFVPGDAGPSWSGYLGGAGNDTASTIGLAGGGAVYVGGATESPDFPVFMGLQSVHGGFGTYDGWVAKIAAGGGGMPWSTFLGGAGNDSLAELAANTDGTLWLAGRTTSPDLPVTADALQTTYAGGTGDGLLVRMAADGRSLPYATYLGGSGGEGIDGLVRIDDDAVAVTGGTDSTDFPVTPAALQTANAGGVDMFVSSIGPPVPQETCWPPGPPPVRPPDPPANPGCR